VKVYNAIATGGSSASAEADCPAGSRATGGGVLAGPGDTVTMNVPVQAGGVLVPDGGTPTGWFGAVEDGALFGASTLVKVSVVCAS
jgi:hypothetical protein